MKPPVSPPYAVQCRAWEAGYVLWEEYRDRLPIRERVLIASVVRMHPDRLGWSECRAMLGLYAAVAGVRV
jgi:hypothetical protein